MNIIQEPVVAGAFYPADPHALSETIANYLDAARAKNLDTLPVPKAIIAPHAGYVYSGSVAASAYACLTQATHIRRVAVLAPAHRYPFQGIALPEATAFATPLGSIPVDQTAIASLRQLDDVEIVTSAYAEEHALEVQLPFLQTVLSDFSLIPMIIGHTSGEHVALALDHIWQEPDTLIVVSSDLSHYHDYATACDMDQSTVTAIEGLQPQRIGLNDACGRLGIQGLLHFAQRQGWTTKCIDLRNSGDTAGSKDQVVGYAAFHIG